MKIVVSQPTPPPECDSSPRRSPAVDMGSGEPGTPQAESQSTQREGIFLLEASVDDFCTTDAQARSRSVFCFNQLLYNKPLLADHRRSGSSRGWQHGLPSKASSLTPEVDRETITFLSIRMSCLVHCMLFFLVFSCVFCLVCNFPKLVKEARRIFT